MGEIRIAKSDLDYVKRLLWQACDFDHWRKILESEYILGYQYREKIKEEKFNPPTTQWREFSSTGDTTFSNYLQALQFLFCSKRFSKSSGFIYGVKCPESLQSLVTFSNSNEIGPCRAGVNCLPISELEGVLLTSEQVAPFRIMTEPYKDKLNIQFTIWIFRNIFKSPR